MRKPCLLTFFVITFLALTIDAKAQNQTTYKWGNVAIGGGGFVSGIVTSRTERSLMYIRTDVGGAYRYDRTSSKWIPLMDWASDQQQGLFGVESIAIDPQNPATVYMLAGISYFNNGKTCILKSTDYGATFTQIDVTSLFKAHGNGMGRQNGEKLQVDPNNSSVLYCGTRWNGMFKSTNGGASWSRLNGLNLTTTPNENGISFVVLDKSSTSAGITQRIFIGVSRSGNQQNLYLSNDAGTTFTALINPGLSANLMPQRAVLSDDGNLFITYANGAGPHGHWALPAEDFTTGQIWKYNISANTWTNVTPAGYNRPFGGISIDPDNPKRLIASTINTYLQQGSQWGDRFFLSIDGGTTWTDIIANRGFELNPDGVAWAGSSSIHWAGSIEFDPSNTNRVWVTSGNGVFMNEDINNSKVWKFHVRGLEETVPLNAVSIPGGVFVSAIGDYDGFRHIDVASYASMHTPAMGTTTGLAFAPKNTSKLARVGASMFYTTDMGLSWIQTGSINGTKGQVALSADGNVILHSPEGSATTYRSTDNGTSWTAVAGVNLSNAIPVADGENPSKFYLYNNNLGAMLVSADGGASFSTAGTVGTGGSRIIRAVPGREGHIWVAGLGNGLLRSVNSGTSFTKVAAVTNCSAIGIGKAAPGSSYETLFIYGTIAGATGVFRSIDEGQNWIRVNDDEHEYGGLGNGQFLIGDMNVFGRVYMSTAGRGIIYGEAIQARNIDLSPALFTVTENAPSGTVIGIPAANNKDETNLHNWSIQLGNDKNVFEIDPSSGRLRIAQGAVLDFEQTSSYTLILGFLDKNNAPAQGTLTINVSDVNEPPTDILISKTYIIHQNTVGESIAELSTIDPDRNSSSQYSLTSGPGAEDNTFFTISGNQLKAATIFNYDVRKVYNIRVKSTDNGGLSTEKAFTLNIKKAGSLPADNLKVKVSNETCAANDDGKILLTANASYNYKATFTSPNTIKEYSFIQNLEIPLLAAGAYTICVSSDELADFNRCFDLVISEPAPLAVISQINESDQTLHLELAGAESYHIDLNGMKLTTTESYLNFPLKHGRNTLQVSTDRTCQGVVQKQFLLANDRSVYPNPFEKILQVNLNDNASGWASAKIYAISGELVHSQMVQMQDGKLQLEAAGIISGTYILKVRTGNQESLFRIIKK